MTVCTIYKSYKTATWVLEGSGDAGHRRQIIGDTSIEIFPSIETYRHEYRNIERPVFPSIEMFQA